MPLESRAPPQPPLPRTNDTQRQSPGPAVVQQRRESLGEVGSREGGKDVSGEVSVVLKCNKLEKGESSAAPEQVIEQKAFLQFPSARNLAPTHSPQAWSPQNAGSGAASDSEAWRSGRRPPAAGPGCPQRRRRSRAPRRRRRPPPAPRASPANFLPPFGSCLPSLLLPRYIRSLKP